MLSCGQEARNKQTVVLDSKDLVNMKNISEVVLVIVGQYSLLSALGLKKALCTLFLPLDGKV